MFFHVLAYSTVQASTATPPTHTHMQAIKVTPPHTCMHAGEHRDPPHTRVHAGQRSNPRLSNLSAPPHHTAANPASTSLTNRDHAWADSGSNTLHPDSGMLDPGSSGQPALSHVDFKAELRERAISRAAARAEAARSLQQHLVRVRGGGACGGGGHGTCVCGGGGHDSCSCCYSCAL